MNIFINTFGSRGDVQPYIILGKALHEKGHKVMLCTSSRFEDEIRENDLDYGYITDEAFQLLDADNSILEDSLGIVGMIRVSARLMKLAKPLNQKMVQNAWDAAKEFKPDLVLFHPKALGAVSIAEAFNVPAMMISLVPLLAPTNEFPIIGMPNFKLGGFNKFTYKLALSGFNSYLQGLNEIRVNQMGLEKLPKSRGVSIKSDGSLVPNIHAISRHVLPEPQDWPDIYQMGGYLYADGGDDWSPSAALQSFLDAGDPPVYVGFGSMSGSNPERLTKIVIEALQKVDQRAILATGWGGLSADDLPESIFKIEHAPHDWLFPRVSAVIHHGGAGTTAAGLRFGRPMVICPFMGDQPFWGDRIEKLGVGVKTVAQKKLSADMLASAIHTVVSDEAMREKSADLGQKIQAENGLENIINSIERIIGNPV